MFDKIRILRFSEGFRKILTNSGYLFIENFLNIVISFAIGIWVIRYLGPEDYGIWKYAQSLVAILSSLAWMGTNPIAIRELVNKPKKEEGKILGTSFTLMLGGGIVSMIIALIIGFLTNSDTITRWVILLTSVNLILQAFTVFDYWFQAKVLSKYSVYARISALLVVNLLKVLFILLSLNVIYFALTVIIGGIIKFFVWLFYYQDLGNKLQKLHFDFNYAKNLLKDSWPLVFAGLSVAICNKIDQVMLKTMVGSDAVGIYASAVRITEIWFFIPVIVSSSVFPAILKYRANDKKKYLSRLQILYDVMAGISIATSIVIAIFSYPLILFLFGKDYSSAGIVLSIHIWTCIFIYLNIIRSKWLISENNQRYELIFNGIGAGINIILNIWLIRRWGILGAAWSTLISYMISGWLMGILFEKTRISFYMQGRAIVNTLLILPFINSVSRFIQISINRN